MSAREIATNAEWAPMPKANETLEGLRSGKLYTLAVASPANGGKPPVKSICIKQGKSKKRGTRLVHLPSLRAYLAKLASEQSIAA